MIRTLRLLAQPEHVTPLLMDDQELDFWGEIYLANPLLARLGISFEAFLAQPRRLIECANVGASVSLQRFFEDLPLLPAQRAARDRDFNTSEWEAV